MKYIGKAALSRGENMAREQVNGFRRNVEESVHGRPSNAVEWK